MATVFRCVCIEDYTVTDPDGTTFTVQRAKEYITSRVLEDGTRRVFSQYWVHVPARIFAGERPGP